MRHVSRGIALKLAQTLFFSLMYVSIKAAGKVPVGEVVFFRGFFALLPLLAWSVYTVGPRTAIRTGRPFFHLARSGVGVASMFFNFSALKLLPLADITAFGFLSPIFAVILAALFLKEHVGRYRWGAVAAGFAGVLLMLEPHGGLSSLFGLTLSRGAVYALVFSFLSATVVILIRQMSSTERGEAIVFYFMSVCAAVGATTMIWDRVALDGWQIFWLVLCGVLGGVGQICMTYCYRYAEPSLLAPFDYASMIWAVALGYLAFAEVPQAFVLAGAGIVIAAGLFIAWRERRLHLKNVGAVVL